ncbi:hypothetical protein ACOKFD_06950 [Flagellimonas sp. S174]|uniref:hypothetical protein n=1 Tax=Flagellimonas sp. S174 TaxID=3410790 RepID=UPI003BF4A972
MKTKNDSNWFRNFTFKQRTFFFDKKGVQTDSAIWYEAVSYPYLFRIDRNLAEKDYTIYRNDSTYQFKNNSLIMATNRPAVHLVFKGGLYFISLEEAMTKLDEYGFDTAVFRKDKFKEELVYVIGEEANQFWLHQEDFYCVRRISTDSRGKKMDVIYDDFKPIGKGWVEQKVTFYYEGKKRLEEFYYDIKLKDTISPKTFSVTKNNQWYLKY